MPNPSDAIVARTEGYTYDSKVWALMHVQGPFSIAPCQTLHRPIRNFHIAKRDGYYCLKDTDA